MIRTFGRCRSLDRMNTLPRASVKTDGHLGTVSIELSANPSTTLAYLGNIHCFGFVWRRRNRNHVWSYDFVEDRTHNRRKYRMLNVSVIRAPDFGRTRHALKKLSIFASFCRS